MATNNVHRVLGVVLLGPYLYTVTHHARILPKLALAPRPALFGGVHNDLPVFGYMAIFALPLVGIMCFICAPQLKRWLSPRIRPGYDYFLDDGFWYALGYVALILGIALLLPFR
jgi:hypothetical protein